MKANGITVLAVFLVWGSLAAAAMAAPRPDDANDSIRSDNRCEEVPTPFVFQVSKPHRTEALESLKSVSSVELTDQQAARLLDEPFSGKALAEVHLDRAIADLKTQRRDELVSQKGAWSVDDEQTLAHLEKIKVDGEAKRLKPFLFRGLMGFETTGGFRATLCGGVLHLFHGSLGHSTPPPTPTGVVVMLREKPVHVKVDFTIAE